MWTSEEDQHATLLESYLLLTGSGDHEARARARKAMIAAGWQHALSGPFEGMVYTTLQEAATRTFYNHVRRLGLDVQTVAPIHGRAVPWSEVVKAVGQSQ